MKPEDQQLHDEIQANSLKCQGDTSITKCSSHSKWEASVQSTARVNKNTQGKILKRCHYFTSSHLCKEKLKKLSSAFPALYSPLTGEGVFGGRQATRRSQLQLLDDPNTNSIPACSIGITFHRALSIVEAIVCEKEQAWLPLIPNFV